MKTFKIDQYLEVRLYGGHIENILQEEIFQRRPKTSAHWKLWWHPPNSEKIRMILKFTYNYILIYFLRISTTISGWYPSISNKWILIAVSLSSRKVISLFFFEISKLRSSHKYTAAINVSSYNFDFRLSKIGQPHIM